ncbi:MAG: homocysteine S-methyltransferase family protein [Oscillospiraceae bacterium]|nr:homocysteine S-methyltransferase family protein [Oscillospiraceae bacterium]
MQDFKTLLRQQVVQFDGGFGTMINAQGLIAPCMESLNLTHPDAVQAVHAAYVAAGAQVVETHSLCTNPLQLRAHGLEDQTEALARAAVQNARAVAKNNALVAYSVGTLGAFLAPLGDLTLDEAVALYTRPMTTAAQAGADLFIIETMTDIADMRAAILAALPLLLPIVASYTFQPNGRTLTGGTPACAALATEALGVTAVGINCSTGPQAMREPLAEMRAATRLPIIVQPNAGLPATDEAGHAHYAMSAEAMAPWMKTILEGGASGIGGCCGTTPAHVARMAALCASLPPLPVRDGQPLICSDRALLPLSQALASHAVCALNAPDVSPLYDLDAPEALLLDVTALTPPQIADALPQAQAVCHAPRLLRAQGVEGLTAALRAYVGRAGVVDVPEGAQKAIEIYGALAEG